MTHSVTKSVLSSVVGVAYDRGMIKSLDDPVKDYVILAEGTPNLRLLRQRTSSIPIVFTVVSEPVAAGFVASLAHPGGNITGFTNLEPSMGEKWLELLKEISPRVSRAALVFNPDTIPVSFQSSRSAQAAADKFAVEVVVAPVRDLAQIEAVMTRVGREQDGGLILPPDSFTAAHRKLIVELGFGSDFH